MWPDWTRLVENESSVFILNEDVNPLIISTITTNNQSLSLKNLGNLLINFMPRKLHWQKSRISIINNYLRSFILTDFKLVVMKS